MRAGYMIPELHRSCEFVFSRAVTASSALPMLQLADLYHWFVMSSQPHHLR